MPEHDLSALTEFEDCARENGFTHWLAHDLMQRLGYKSWPSFHNVINKAIASCAQLNIPVPENFEPVDIRGEDGRTSKSYKLTRFACFLIVMHADAKKEEVQRHRIVFATLAEALLQQTLGDEALERLELREELTQGEKELSSTAHRSGLQNYAFFKDAGYRGMYNMPLAQIKKRKGLKSNCNLYNFLGKTELAANWFRVTQTAEHIRNSGIRGQSALESAARSVGQQVRSTMLSTGGKPPEQLPAEEDIRKVKSRLRTAQRQLRKLDSKPKKRLPPGGADVPI